MARWLVIEELREMLKMPATTTGRQVHAALRMLKDKAVMAEIRRSLRDVFRRHAVLARCRLTVQP